MYAFGFDIPLNVLMAIGLVLHIAELVLLLLIIGKLRKNAKAGRRAKE